VTAALRYRGIDALTAQLKEARNGRCLLSLGKSVFFPKHGVVDIEAQDGGGIRGFSQLLIMEEIAHRIMHGLGLQESPPLCDYFDMIGGVGTGGSAELISHIITSDILRPTQISRHSRRTPGPQGASA
jgi:hypothetical protein